MVIVLDAPVLLLPPPPCPNASFNDMEKIITTRAAMGKRRCLVLPLRCPVLILSLLLLFMCLIASSLLTFHDFAYCFIDCSFCYVACIFSCSSNVLQNESYTIRLTVYFFAFL